MCTLIDGEKESNYKADCGQVINQKGKLKACPACGVVRLSRERQASSLREEGPSSNALITISHLSIPISSTPPQPS